MGKSSTSWKPGQSGNPKGGIKKEWSWSGLLRDLADEIDGKSGLEKKQIIANALFKQAYRGNVIAIKEFGDRIDGKAQQAIDHTTNGKDITVTIKDYGVDNNPTKKTKRSP